MVIQPMGKKQIMCSRCGKAFHKYPSAIRERNFCSNRCRLSWFGEWTTEIMNVRGHSAGHKAPHLTAYNNARRNSDRPQRMHDNNEQSCSIPFSERTMYRNKMDNPMWYAETREKVSRALRDRGEGKTYRKYLGRHEHRVVAEMTLGRSLRKGEVVHHIDGNKRNNAADNLMIFASQAEHARFHQSKGRW